MRKAEHRRAKSYKAECVQDRLRHRGIYLSITPKWTKWAKRYLARRNRRVDYK